MPDIGMNGRVLNKPNPAGVTRYTSQLLNSVGNQTQDPVTVIGATEVSGLPENIGFEQQVPAHSGVRAHLWEQLQLPSIIDSHDFDVFHTPAGQPPIRSRTPLVTTIHDISPVTHPEWFSRPYVALYRLLTPLSIRASDHIITVSEFAKSEICDRYPAARGKIIAIHNGVVPRKPKSGTPYDEVNPDEFLLFVGSHNPRKNLDRTLRAYGQYRSHTKDPLPLIVVGTEREVFARTDLPDVTGVLQAGYVSESNLTWLYDNAVCFVFPSLYEGFGLPILEAMSLGTPVLTSDQGAMAEVSGDAAHLVNPYSIREISHGIKRIVSSGGYQQQLSEMGRERARSFTWDKTARRTIEVYHQVAEKP